MDHQLETIKIYDQHVNEYINKFMNMDLYNDTFNDFLNLLNPKDSILELGCGPGNVVKYFLDKKSELKILGLDLAPNMLIQARTINPTAKFELMDIRNIHNMTEKFNAIVGSFCIPYLSYSDIETFFNNLNILLLHNGLIYISCMEGEVEKSGFEETSFTGNNQLYIYYHQREKLENLLTKNHFVIEKFYTKDYPESDGTFTTDLIYIARKINEA